MPEGDTIHRAAGRLHRALGGATVTEFRSVFPQLLRIDEDAPIAGRSVEKVSAAGKNLLIHFSGDLVLRTHMRMNGTWHLYRPGERWQRRRADMRILIGTRDFVAVAFTVPIAEFLNARQIARHEDLRRIGPDVLAETFDRDEAVRRIRNRPELDIADALLNQRLISGIGNVFKSEILFESNVNPFRKVPTITHSEMAGMMRVAEKQMRLNARGKDAQRATTGRLRPGEHLWVYGRGGKPCYRCGTPIESKKQGRDARLTFWCPRCQR